MNSCKIGGSVVVLYFFLLLFICVHANEAHVVLPKEDIYFYLLFNRCMQDGYAYFSLQMFLFIRGALLLLTFI